MVNNYPEYAAGVNYKKTDTDGNRHFYSAQVVADPANETVESKLIKDGVVIDEGGATVEALNVTENGTYSEEGKAYSPVVVNVAGGASDFTIAEVSIVVSGEPNTDPPINLPICNSIEGLGNFAMASSVMLPNETTGVILYKGKCIAAVTGDEYYDLNDFSVSGNATLDKEQGLLTITGDCTITCVYTPIS